MVLTSNVFFIDNHFNLSLNNTQDQNKGKRKLHITADKTWLQQIKKAMTNGTRKHWGRECCSLPVSRMQHACSLQFSND